MTATLRSPLKAARGWGAAKEGTAHFIWSRITAIALAPLSIWFVVVALGFVNGGYTDARVFMAQPLNAVLMATFVITLFHHTAIGLQVVIEDYIHVRWLEFTLHLAVKAIAFVATIVCLFALVRIALGA